MSAKKPSYEDGALPPAEYRAKVLGTKQKKLQKYLEPTQGGATHRVKKRELRIVFEKVIQCEIINYLRGLGWYVFKVKAANLVGKSDAMVLASSEKGVPDLLCCAPGGKFVGIEVKRANGKANVSADQRAHIDRLRRTGAHAFVAHSIGCVERYLTDSGDLAVQPNWPNY